MAEMALDGMEWGFECQTKPLGLLLSSWESWKVFRAGEWLTQPSHL